MNFRRLAWGLVLAVLSVFTSGCYHVTGRDAGTVPKTVQTVAVLPFFNGSTRYKLTDRLQDAIMREMIARTRFQIVRDRKNADAILQGGINAVGNVPVVFDPRSGKTTIVQVSAILQCSLIDAKTGKVLYQRAPFEVRNNYQISLFANQYFDESNLALDRVAADFAKTIVSGILENF